MSLIDILRASMARPLHETPELLAGDSSDLDLSGDGAVRAAVLVPIVARPEPTVILTRRSEALRSHPGQVSFPGGRIDPDDDGPVGAALREALEEIALPPARVDVLGVLESYVTNTGFSITPVVGIIQPGLSLVPRAAEVARVFEVPLHVLLEPSNHIEQSVEWQGHDRHYYEISWDGERIWGATAAMVVNLARRLAYR